jgi:hypothetical protein
MHWAEVIARLLEQACPSIRYRLSSEILGRPAADQDMQQLQDLVLDDPAVQAVLSWQESDGWLGWNFHGARGTETGVRLLCEKGVERSQPGLARALQALEDHPDRLGRGIGKPGKILDEMGFGGEQMMRAALFARAGLEDRSFVNAQVETALGCLDMVMSVHSLEALVEPYKGRLVFKRGVQWPSIYHLRLLAFTQGWRTADNRNKVTEAVKRLVELSPLPSAGVRYKSQVIAPASFGMHDFNPDMGAMDASGWMMWFQRMDYLARLGVAQAVPELRQQVTTLANQLEGGGGRFTKKLTHPYFTHWGAYTGLILEKDWRTPARRENDLSFRSLSILYLAEGSAQTGSGNQILV